MRQLKNNIFAVGAMDWERRLFDELIPLPDGTTYNAYLVIGSEKTALLDTVDPGKTDVLLHNLEQAGIDQLDYLVSHHAEQDHSGSIPHVLARFPQARILTNPKCRDMLIDHLGLAAKQFGTVSDGEKISLGDKTLQFIYTPWVHWPETMSTYVPEDKILFSCDFFGSHLAASDLYADTRPKVYSAAKRYYAEIMMPFRGPIRKNLEKLAAYEFDLIAPSHGPVYNQPDFILNAYRDWTSDDVKNEVVLPYVSMHHSTRQMVDYFIAALMARDITVKPHNLTSVDIGILAMDLVDAATLVIGTPMVLASPHPYAAYAAYLANLLRPKTKFLSIIGSFGWGGSFIDQLKAMVPFIKAEILEPVTVKGLPRSKDFQALDHLADAIQARHSQVIS